MRKISFVRLCLSVLILFSTFACEKNDVIPTKEATTQSDYAVVDGVLTFSSDEACQRTVEMVNKMTEEERLTWEKSINFRSLGTIADQFYYSIDFDKFSSLEELIGFFNNNSDKLLVENESGEYSFEPKEQGNINRYIVNKDGIYAVENTAYKEMDGQIFSASIDNIRALQSVSNRDEENQQIFDKSVIFKVNTYINERSEYGYAYEPGNNKYFKYRMKATMKSVIKNKTQWNGILATHELQLEINNDVRGIFGAWFAEKSTTSYDVSITGQVSGDNKSYTVLLAQNEILQSTVNDGGFRELGLSQMQLLIPAWLVSYTVYATNWKGCVISAMWGNV